ncbi:hypothetical protein HaLaN_12028 [Haematococcus lacustris]|uniref:Uncharacterized protein n=1 Tax=Haematococcus lacustris TaxID=44745 RepID=A0A699Z9E3_HAELA|nr:hypothetical protein HaLaN_12028 [Haematococcus lacustris]
MVGAGRAPGGSSSLNARRSSNGPRSGGQTVPWPWPMGQLASMAAAPLAAGVLKEALRQLPAGRVVMVDEF